MRAAVVRSFDSAPKFEAYPTPVPSRTTEVLVDVVAVGLHPRVRSQASGSHYTSTDELPLVPGIDGVGRLPDGHLRYFILPDTTMGSMSEQTVIDVRRSIALTDGADTTLIAAAMNPGMSSWVALRRRIDFRADSKVLVLGATGSAGQMAVQISKYLGASKVVGAGRDPKRLEALKGLGADAIVSLSGDDTQVAEHLGAAASEVDVVIDYLWGQPAERAFLALLRPRADRGRALTWIQVGSIAGRTAALPSEALRSANVQVIGSGQGSVSTGNILAELPALAEAITQGAFKIETRTMPLADVEEAWATPIDGSQRIVLTPRA